MSSTEDGAERSGGGSGLQKETSSRKLKKKLSRRGSAPDMPGEGERKTRRSKRSNRRLLEGLSSSMTSIPSNLTRGNALERFNSLTLDEQIALKLASKLNGKDDESNSVCSLGSMDSGYEEGNGRGKDDLQRRKCLTLDEQLALKMATKSNVRGDAGKNSNSISSSDSIDSGYSDEEVCAKPPSQISICPESTVDYRLGESDVSLGNSLACEIIKNNSSNTAGGRSNIFAAEKMISRKLSRGSVLTSGKSTSASYEERLKKKLSNASMSDEKKTQLPKIWSCQKCTYMNKMESLACEICSASRDGSIPGEKNFRRTPGATFVPGYGSTGWKCKTCTYKENKLEALVCEICSAPRDGTTPNETNSTPDGTASTGWQCKTCTYKENKLEALVCEVCSAPRDGAIPNHMHSTRTHSAIAVPGPGCGWQCKVCTYTNYDTRATFCGACGSEH
ncbi:hypothetical protein ACHAWO_002269 [Cyclotella atomus]|uniref:RanBP2-type domain-containing protein n=1 Tax=Cyclotella atomus TaxID=382360 RepID=A0ABD3Q2E2_9STRA